MEQLVIGICGGTGSGKTTLAEYLSRELEDRSVLISMDSFYKAQPGTTYEERVLTNYDHPAAYDTQVMVDCIKDLKEGRSTSIPIYDFTIHNRSDKPWVNIESKPVIIIEGILLFAIEEVRDLMDIRVFVDTEADVRILRRILRDVNERQRSVESVINQYLTTVKPMHDAFIEPSKKYADIIVPEGGMNKVACELLLRSIRHRMGQKDQ